MRKVSLLSCCVAGVVMVAGAGSALAAVIDTFDTAASASAYTQTTILDQDATVATSISSPSGVLTVSKTAGVNAEQNVYLRSDFTLGVGEVLRVDYTPPSPVATAYADFGIVVSAPPTGIVYTSGTVSSRANYAAIYANSNQQLVKTIGFSTLNTQIAGSPGGLNPVGGFAALTGLYIARTAETSYAVGYQVAGVDTQFFVYTLTDPGVPTRLGIYSDVRAVTSVGALDNLRIEAIPEPAGMGMLGLMVPMLMRRRK